jgi:hypothetical protein
VTYLLALLAILWGFSFLLALVVAGAVLPIWAIVDCILTRQSKPPHFVLVAVLTAITTPVGPVVYACFMASSRYLRRLGFATFTIGVITMLIALAVMPHWWTVAQQENASLRERNMAAELDGIAETERSAFGTALSEMSETFSGFPYRRLGLRARNHKLQTLAGAFLKDKRLSRAEFDEWMRWKNQGPSEWSKGPTLTERVKAVKDVSLPSR